MIQYDVVLNFVTKMNGGSPAKMIDKSVTPVVALKKAFSQMIDLEKFKEMGMDLSDYGTEMTKVQKTVSNLGGDFGKMSASAKKLSKGFDMSMMSVMFFGMQIQKTFLGIFNSMLNTFKLLDKKGIMPLNRALTKMEAAFTFLSFVVIKAMEPILLPIIDAIVGLVDWFSQLPEPILAAVGTIALLVGAIGGLMFVAGTVKLGADGLGMTSFIESAKTAATTLYSSQGLVAGLTTVAAMLILAGIGLTLLTAEQQTFSNNSETFNGFIDRINENLKELSTNLLGIELQLPELTDAWTTAWSGLQTSLGIITVGILALFEQLTNGLLILYDSFMVFPKGISAFLEGKGLSGFVEGYSKLFEDFGKVGETAGKAFQESFNVVATEKGLLEAKSINAKNKTNYLDTTEQKKSSTGNVDYFNLGSNSIFDYSQGISSSTPKVQQSIAMCVKPVTDTLGGEKLPTTGPLASVPQKGYDLMSAYSTKMNEASPLINQTMTEVFSSAGQTMFEINNMWVEKTIADTNRALEKIRELENKSKSTSSKSSTVNNNKSIYINVKGSDQNKMVMELKKAVAL